MTPKYRNGREAKVGDWVIHLPDDSPDLTQRPDIIFGQVRRADGDLEDGCILVGLGHLGARSIESCKCYRADDAWAAAEMAMARPMVDMNHPDCVKALETIQSGVGIQIKEGDITRTTHDSNMQTIEWNTKRNLDCVATDGCKVSTQTVKP